jgi:hypothetical protein
MCQYLYPGTEFTCFTSTQAQILAGRCSVGGKGVRIARQVLSLLALLLYGILHLFDAFVENHIILLVFLRLSE